MVDKLDMFFPVEVSFVVMSDYDMCLLTHIYNVVVYNSAGVCMATVLGFYSCFLLYKSTVPSRISSCIFPPMLVGNHLLSYFYKP